MPDVWMKISQASAIFQKMKLEDVVAVLDVAQVSFKKQYFWNKVKCSL
jgi:hypothetical protein